MSDPLAELRAWVADAAAAGLPEPSAMALATATADGRPSVRFVLLKGVDERGLRFYGNAESRKGRELAENPRAAVTLHWAPLARAVRAEGPVEPLGDAEADAYYASRERGSRLGAWASPQGREIPGRAWLEARLEEAAARFPGDAVPRPPYWGGWRLVPDAIELWHGRPSRLHDRVSYTLAEDGAWRAARLAP